MRFVLSMLVVLALVYPALAQDPKASAFPRRMLFIQISDYFYLNPLTHGTPGGADRVREAAGKLAFGLRVPSAKDNDQLFVVADTLVTDASLPTKDVLATTLDRFCATTREQDRVVIYFGVHATEKDGKAFVIPIDGDLDTAGSLLPVADVYAKLKELKAAQKIVIWDVCRKNPERVRGRRDAGPMTPELLKALTTAPEGVQVLVSCKADEYSRESFAPPGTNSGSFPGGIYLNALRRAGTNDRIANPDAKPGEAIPIEELHKATTKLVSRAVKGQTPVLAGTAPKEVALFNAKEAPAKRFELPPLPKDTPSAEVKGILEELAIPPILEGDSTKAISRVAFAEAAFKGYASDVSSEEILKDVEKYPLRVVTLHALQTVRNTWRLDGKEQKIVHSFLSPISDAMKKAVAQAQETVAISIIGLELELDRLKEVAGHRAKETKRWQAHYDYAVAEIRLRLVILNEYNRALGNIRTEALPDLGGSTGWQLAPATKLEAKKDIQRLYSDAKGGFEQILADHKGTPWAVLAKRSLATQPGARWEPIPPLPDGK